MTYMKSGKRAKNLVEIEVRNDSEQHYREIRFNMYSADALMILTGRWKEKKKKLGPQVIVYGAAVDTLP
jgi:hypothetical protein